MKSAFVVVALSLLGSSAGAAPDGYASLGVGNGHVGHADDEARSQTMFIGAELGMRVSERLHVVTRTGDWLLGRYSPDPSLTQSYGAVTVGVHFDPLPPPGEGPLALSMLHAEAGRGLRFHDPASRRRSWVAIATRLAGRSARPWPGFLCAAASGGWD